MHISKVQYMVSVNCLYIRNLVREALSHWKVQLKWAYHMLVSGRQTSMAAGISAGRRTAWSLTSHVQISW